MSLLPESLRQRLAQREERGLLRTLSPAGFEIDFYSNDYLGFSRNAEIQLLADDLSKDFTDKMGSGGSRLISGNHSLYGQTEDFLKSFYQAPAALIFNSGYNANVGLFASLPQKDDVVLYDEYIHASIREGLSISLSKSYKFRHNDLEDLEKLSRHPNVLKALEVYVAVESLYSMDGDSPDLAALVSFCKSKNFYLIVDEAHSVGLFGDGAGMLCELGLQDDVFARVVTFGKAFGSHGAAVLGDNLLKSFLVNFARSFIYTTALPPQSVAGILAAHRYAGREAFRQRLFDNIDFFIKTTTALGLTDFFIKGRSPIQIFIPPKGLNVTYLEKKLRQRSFGVKGILAPTVPADSERLRLSLHSYNTQGEIEDILSLIHKEI